MPDLKEKVDKLVKDFVDAVSEVEKGVSEKDSEAYNKFMDYDNSYLSDTDVKKIKMVEVWKWVIVIFIKGQTNIT